MASQIEKARYFSDLHVPGKPVILYNIWDAGSAAAVTRGGAKAIATGSWSIAAAHGYADGEEMPLDDALAIVGRIVKSTELPITADFEGGYAVDPAAVAENVRKLLTLGVVGLNFEDQVVGAPGLHGIDAQSARIRAVRQAADDLGIPAFINARTDVFLKAAAGVDHAGLLDEAIAREAAYREAGADGCFVPGLTDEGLIRKFCESTTLPVNVMAGSTFRDIDKIASLGAARISFGPTPFIGLMDRLEQEARSLAPA